LSNALKTLTPVVAPRHAVKKGRELNSRAGPWEFEVVPNLEGLRGDTKYL
jgi:hypothetical protein